MPEPKDRRTLDRSKPYGIVCGNHGASYTQEGVHFDNLGVELFDDEIKILQAESFPVPAPAPAADGALLLLVQELADKVKEQTDRIDALSDALGATQGQLAEFAQATEVVQGTWEAKMAEMDAKINDANFPSQPAPAKGGK